MYKLIAIDLDGTLLNDQHQISLEAREAIRAAKQRGVMIVLCSGRAIRGVQPYLEELNLTEDGDYVISFNGALIQNANTNEVVSRYSLCWEDLKCLYTLSQKLNTSMHFFDYTTMYTLNQNISKYTVFESYITQIPLRYCKLEDISETMWLPKIMFIDEPNHLNDVIASIPSSLTQRYSMVSSAPYFFEFLHPDASKGNAVKKLARQLGIEQHEVMCIGDNGNDLSMIEYAGCGVAMANAIPELKEIADYQTFSNNQNGVAHAIQNLVL